MDHDLAAILPHRPPMVMLDALVRSGGDAAVATKTFAPDSYGVHEGRVLESALVECLAQTVAALHGQRARQDGRPPAMGMLVGVSDFVFHRPGQCGSPLTLSVEVTRRLGPLVLALGRVEQNGELVAEGYVKLHVQEERHDTTQE